MRRTPRTGKIGPAQTQTGPHHHNAPTTPTKSLIKLNVGGQIFQTTADTLQSLPNTRLGRLARSAVYSKPPEKELFFDRNPDIINCLLDFYRTGELHLPRHLCVNTIERELKFWEIPQELVQECCFKQIEEYNDAAHITVEIDKFLTVPYESSAEMQTLSTKNKIWLIMERPRLCRTSKIWNTLYFTIVVFSVIFYCLETVLSFRNPKPFVYALSAFHNITTDQHLASLDLKEKYGVTDIVTWLRDIQYATFVFFVGEFIVRLITCPDKKYFMKQLKNWLDIFLLLQSCLTIYLEDVFLKAKPMKTFSNAERNSLIFFYCLSVLRVLRIIYLAKSFDTMKILILSTKASLRVLVLLGICVMSLATIFGTSVFLAEVLADEFTVTSIPFGMWYAIVTMTTVGYGDVVPVSTAGKVLGMLCALCGVIVMALPIAVIASRFTTYHDNISARQQKKSRLAFLKDHPEFQNGKEEVDEAPMEVAKHEQEKPFKNGEVEIMDEEESTCFKLCPLRRNTRKVKSHSIWVSEYTSSSSSSSTTPRGSDKAASQPQTPSSVGGITDNFSS
ncbi:hypothetical protein ACOMHN_038250 [Nucella lapillus]